MPATLLLIRHGQTPGNLARVFRGADGPSEPLDDTGRAQAQALGAALARVHLPRPRLYASPYLRAQQTGQHLAQSLKVPLHTLAGIHEIDTGDWMGRPYSAMQTHLHELTAPDGEFGYPGGESLVGVGQRFHAALSSLKPQDGETVIVVSHGAALVALLARLLNRDARAAWLADELKHANTAVTELSWPGEGQPTVVRLADTAHLNAGEALKF
jgi:broad specificity phosphatase PhoE